jgi:hypothetical protein
MTEPLSFEVVVSRRRRYAAATDGPCTALLGLSALIGRFPEQRHSERQVFYARCAS